jgi:hypothetical protein
LQKRRISIHATADFTHGKQCSETDFESLCRNTDQGLSRLQFELRMKSNTPVLVAPESTPQGFGCLIEDAHVILRSNICNMSPKTGTKLSLDTMSFSNF